MQAMTGSPWRGVRLPPRPHAAALTTLPGIARPFPAQAERAKVEKSNGEPFRHDSRSSCESTNGHLARLQSNQTQ